MAYSFISLEVEFTDDSVTEHIRTKCIKSKRTTAKSTYKRQNIERQNLYNVTKRIRTDVYKD